MSTALGDPETRLGEGESILDFPGTLTASARGHFGDI